MRRVGPWKARMRRFQQETEEKNGKTSSTHSLSPIKFKPYRVDRLGEEDQQGTFTASTELEDALELFTTGEGLENEEEL